MTTLWPEQRLQEVEARLKAATSGPWRVSEQDILTGDTDGWDVMSGPAEEPTCVAADLRSGADARLLASIPTDLADAVVEIRRLQAMKAEAERSGRFCPKGHYIPFGEDHGC